MFGILSFHVIFKTLGSYELRRKYYRAVLLGRAVMVFVRGVIHCGGDAAQLA